MDEKKLDDVGNFIAKIGFPVAVAILLTGLVVWLIYNQQTKTDQLIEADTAAKTEMTSAIKSLETASIQVSSSLKSLEIETSKRLNLIEMRIEDK